VVIGTALATRSDKLLEFGSRLLALEMDSPYPAVIVQLLLTFPQFADWQLLLWESLPIFPFDAGGDYALDRQEVTATAFCAAGSLSLLRSAPSEVEE